MALDQAIYVASTDKIYGVRGQWVFQFNATTGVLEKSARFANDALFGESSIVNIGSFLYIGTWRTITNPNVSPFGTGDIYKVDLALTTSVALGLFSSTNGYGFSNLVTDGTLIWGTTGFDRTFTARQVFHVNPSPSAYTEIQTASGSGAHPIVDVEWDANYNVLWMAESIGPQVEGFCIAATPKMANIGNPAPPQLFGLTRYPAAQKLYCVGRNQNVIKLNADQAVATLPASFSTATWTSLAGLLLANATPIKIKFNAHDSLIYVPEWNNDTVQVINPATDLVVGSQTGFSSPIDCVFQTVAPFTKWAVQNSAVGLKQITIP